MKKIILLLLAIFTLSQVNYAQKRNDAKTKGAATEQTEGKKDPKMKKDGTPDKRFKENKEPKEAAKPAGPLKKDGTPDMRHKANKEAAKKK